MNLSQIYWIGCSTILEMSIKTSRGYIFPKQDDLCMYINQLNRFQSLLPVLVIMLRVPFGGLHSSIYSTQ